MQEKMKSNFNMYFTIATYLFIITSCDKKTPVIAVKNNTSNIVSGASLVDDSLTNSDLYNNRVDMNILLKPGQFQDVGVLFFRFGGQNATSKLYLYIFQNDSLNKYLQQKEPEDIIGKSLIKKVVVQLNKLNELDTIYVK